MFIKRLFDIFFAIACAIVLTLPIICIAIIIKYDSPGPIIFFSKRFGKNKNLFFMPKFRTMSNNTPQVATNLLENSERYITKFGGFLRKTSLDEIPQIWSIIKGEMTFVGPRPALFNQYELIKSREVYKINSLTPGLTGWAQINGRDELSIDKKVETEKFYKENQSFFLDLKILYLTFLKVIKMNDIKH